jgi:hypothetical protein
VPHITVPIDRFNGPVIALVVGVSFAKHSILKKKGMTAPNPVVMHFLVDSGASHTVVDAQAIAPLGITPTGITYIHTPSTGDTPVAVQQYDVSLFLHHPDNSKMIPNLAVTASDFSKQNIQGLLGRDVLEHCLLVYDGRAGSFALAF